MPRFWLLSFFKRYYVDLTAKYSAGANNKLFYEAVPSGKSKPVSISKGNR